MVANDYCNELLLTKSLLLMMMPPPLVLAVREAPRIFERLQILQRITCSLFA